MIWWVSFIEQCRFHQSVDGMVGEIPILSLPCIKVRGGFGYCWEITNFSSRRCPGSDFGLASSPSHQSPLIPTLHSFPISHISVTWQTIDESRLGICVTWQFARFLLQDTLPMDELSRQTVVLHVSHPLPNHPGSQSLVFHWVDHFARPFKHEVIRLTPWLYRQELSLILLFLLFMSDDAILPFRLATFLIFPFYTPSIILHFPIRRSDRIAG